MTIPRTLDSRLVEAYREYGLEVTAPKGNCWFGKTMVCTEHDGVPYCMDGHSNGDYAHGVRHRQLIIERHHERIKSVYEYCKALGVGDIWVLSGGGGQLQAFFGNNTGYLAILYLDMENLAEQDELEDYLDACGNTTFELHVNFTKNDPLFEGKFNIPGITMRTSREVFGDDDEDEV
jgi:hypothetical protein